MRIRVKLAEELCACNSCLAQNYDADHPIGKRVDRLLEVQIGQMVNTLCPKCALELCVKLEGEISEASESARNRRTTQREVE